MIEKIKAEIERRYNDNLEAEEMAHTGHFGSAAKEDYDLLSFIESLEKESIAVTKDHPLVKDAIRAEKEKKVVDKVTAIVKPLTEEQKQPQGLDRAAIDHVDSIPDGGTAKHPWNDEDIEYAFKAGAKWIAEQGVSYEERVIKLGNDSGIIERVFHCPDDCKDGDKVIVQIRKK